MNLNGRDVVDVEVDGVDSTDYPDFCDAYFYGAVFADTGEELGDLELEALQQKYPDVLGQMAFESLQ